MVAAPAEAREGVTMRLSPLLVALLALASAAALLTAAPALAAPEIGQPAPDFLFVGVADVVPDGGRVQLSDYVGEGARKKGVVVAWFPKAFTPG